MNSEQYEQYRKTKLESGLLYQDFVVDLLFQTIGLVVVQYASQLYQTQVGESRTGVEIKHDEKYGKTGNLWIEVAEKARPRPGDYVPSGINRADNSWLYVIGDYDVVFGFSKTLLQALSKQEDRYPIRPNGTKTSMGFLLPDKYAKRYAAFVLTPQCEQKIAKSVRDLHELGRLLHKTILDNPSQQSFFDADDGPVSDHGSETHP